MSDAVPIGKPSTGGAAALGSVTRPLRPLVVEDQEVDYEFVLIMLRKHGFSIQSRRVETRAAMRQALAEAEWDIVISDHNLPEFSSMGALETLKESGLELPFVIVSGEIGEDVAVAAMRAGVDDYLIKDRLARLGAAVESAIERSSARRKRQAAEDELRLSEGRLAALSSHLETVKEKERGEVARALHDEIGNALAAIHFQLATVVKGLPAGATEAQTAAAAIRDTVNRGIATLQRMMMNLRPSILDAGLVAALQWLTRDTGRRASLAATFSGNRDEIEAPAEMSTAAFRVCQEALNNVVLHAKATAVHVELFADNDNLTLEVRDNGIGMIDPEPGSKVGFGVFGMRARARSLGGWLEVSSTAHGTSVMLSLPLRIIQATLDRK
ncbi:hypothetical protein BH10PSE17_BH10PSE17_37810 [soil metagenome]